MHAVTHSLAHRAPPATRTRVRWQPYNSIPTSSIASARSPPATYLNTPVSSVSSPTPNSSLFCDIERLRQPTPCPTSQGSTKEYGSRDSKNKFAAGLVDQAVKSLSEIWRPQDIPSVFLISPRAMVTIGASLESIHSINQLSASKQKPLTEAKTHRHQNRNTQLPSPISPSTQPSPGDATPSTSLPAIIPQLLQPDQDMKMSLGSQYNLVPIKGFVHEVLKRSRTSACVLQTALCYLEAIRSQIPELIRKENLGEGVRGEPDLSNRIVPATSAELDREAEYNMSLDTIINTDGCAEDIMDTIRISDDLFEGNVSSEGYHLQGNSTILQGTRKPKSPSPLMTPVPPLPSPLLCPRRAFLASLILASKFTQDKCYSNRAWAKLSGLPPREIGRCERALGEALDWRLWVGKVSATPATPTLPAFASKPIMRSQSESSLLSAAIGEAPFLAPSEDMFPVSSALKGTRGLRRSVTLPADSFTGQHTGLIPGNQNTTWSNDKSFSFRAPQDRTVESDSNPINLDPSVKSNVLDAYMLSDQSMTNYSEKIHESPSPQTPGLSYSPSSTGSSSGDRTIQMTTFDSMVSINSSTCSIGTESWPWLDTSDVGISCVKISQLPCSHGSMFIANTDTSMDLCSSVPETVELTDSRAFFGRPNHELREMEGVGLSELHSNF